MMCSNHIKKVFVFIFIFIFIMPRRKLKMYLQCIEEFRCLLGKHKAWLTRLATPVIVHWGSDESQIIPDNIIQMPTKAALRNISWESSDNHLYGPALIRPWKSQNYPALYGILPHRHYGAKDQSDPAYLRRKKEEIPTQMECRCAFQAHTDASDDF